MSDSYITAASTAHWNKFGYVFLKCKLIAAPAAKKVFLGRPWRAYARTVFIECEMGDHIRPEGWHNWGKIENEQTAFYGEYKSYGAGANPGSRVNWSKQLSKKEAKRYTLKNIFAGSAAWIPNSN